MKRVRPIIPDVLPLIRAYYAKPGNEVGGSLHIVLEDMNVADSDVRFCIKWADEHDDGWGAILGHMLLCMTRTQRSKLAAIR